jgi:hypothetical protein
MSEPGRAVGLARGVPTIIPSSSSRRGGAGAATVHDRLSLRRHRGGGDEQAYHRIDGVVQPPVVCRSPARAAITTGSLFLSVLLRATAMPDDKITAAATDAVSNESRALINCVPQPPQALFAQLPKQQNLFFSRPVACARDARLGLIRSDK